MPHNDEVGVVAYHQDSVFESFALSYAAVGSIGKSDDAGSEPIGRAFETQAGTGGGLKEQGGYHLVLENALLRILFKTFGHVQNMQLFFFGEVGNRDEVFVFHNALLLECE